MEFSNLPLTQVSLNPLGWVEIVDFLVQFLKSLAQMASTMCIKIKIPILLAHMYLYMYIVPYW